MSSMLKKIHNPAERSLYASCVLGINLNVTYDSYGGSRSIMAMKDEEILIHSTLDHVNVFLISLFNKVNAILASVSSEDINHQDKDACIKSLSRTCAPTKCVEIYLKWIYKNESLIRELK